MPFENYFAHSQPNETFETWEPLDRHLDDVAKLAAQFAAAFASEEWGRIAGLWHDLGKYSDAFQRRIRGVREQAPHASTGAVLAKHRGALPLAFAIAGHHAGLSNHIEPDVSGPSPLTERLSEGEPIFAEIAPIIPAHLQSVSLPLIPAFLQPLSPHTVELWTRFLFSALVDADFLATEAFYDGQRRSTVTAVDPIDVIADRLDSHLDAFPSDSPVNHIRAEILAACRAAAPMAPGLFSLTVPTGGGKTLSALSFALRHARQHGLRRVIVVIPFTSIIEQTAEVYRKYVGKQNVVEYHSALDEQRASEIDGESELKRRLAAENWDAPIIVTTAVQFFESLFSNRPSRCRKLHNIAQSVVIIDEAQTLPVDFMLCVLDVLRQLAEFYNSSILLSTATQPALIRRDALPQGLANVREIIPAGTNLETRLQRVAVQWPAPGVTTSFESLAGTLAIHPHVLAIVHRREDARQLASLLPDNGCFHLSALMCAAHRFEVLSQVKEILQHGETCRLVTTQLVEAGVDIDFPIVYRANAGLDSLAQAAGRCNREGQLRDQTGRPLLGQFIVFNAETNPPRGLLTRGLDIAVAMQSEYGEALDLSHHTYMTEYFRRLYHTDLDKCHVMRARATLNFATVARLVQLVDDQARVPVIVPWRDAYKRLQKHRHFPSRSTQRSLQPYVVQIARWTADKMIAAGTLERVESNGELYAVSELYSDIYDARFGLIVGETPSAPGRYVL